MTILTTATARTAVATLAILGLSTGVAAANPCESDPSFAAANGCDDVFVESAELSITAAAEVTSDALPAGLGLRVR